MLFVRLASSFVVPETPTGVSIIVGQVSSTLLPTTSEIATHYVLAESYVCSSIDVIVEQMECLERVLPFGIQVLGLAGSPAGVRTARALLKESSSQMQTLMALESTIDENEPLKAYLLTSMMTKIRIMREEVQFVQLPCELHTLQPAFPFLLSTSGRPAQLVESCSTLPLFERQCRDAMPIELVQLGSNSGRIPLKVVVCLPYMSGRSLFDVLTAQLRRCVNAGETQMIELRSYNAHLSYCCQLKRDTVISSGKWSGALLQEIEDMIEDATGRQIDAFSNLIDAPLIMEKYDKYAPAQTSPKKKAALVSFVRWKGNDPRNMTYLLFGLLILIVGMIVLRG